MGTFYTNLLPQSFTLKIEVGRSFEMSVNEYQNIRRHNPEGPNFDTAGRRHILEDILQAKLKK
jgi:hypothetical protein